VLIACLAEHGFGWTVGARPGRLELLGALSVFHSKCSLYDAFVWARRALSSPKRRVPARAGAGAVRPHAAARAEGRGRPRRRPVRRRHAGRPALADRGTARTRSHCRLYYCSSTLYHIR
jgi:hypothetical protein